uniref:Uncharacterized protein n=1 Tax=Anopheles maculatus TaxID=74869 RepID=A0A182SZR3_9DIPT
MEDASQLHLSSEEEEADNTVVEQTGEQSTLISKNEATPRVVVAYEEKGTKRSQAAPGVATGKDMGVHRMKRSGAVLERDMAIATIRRISNFVSSYVVSKVQAEVRHRALEQAWGDFRRVQLQIMDEERQDDGSYEEIEEIYYEAAERLSEIISASEIKPRADVIVASSNQVRLPKLTLPTFDGAYDSWMPFHDLYKQVVHDNASLSNVEKAFYLRSFLVAPTMPPGQR